MGRGQKLGDDEGKEIRTAEFGEAWFRKLLSMVDQKFVEKLNRTAFVKIILQKNQPN